MLQQIPCLVSHWYFLGIFFDMEIIIALFFFGLLSLVISIDFLIFLATGKRLYNESWVRTIALFAMILLPLVFFQFLDESENNCCTESAMFSPDHKLTIYFWITISIAAFFYSFYRTSISSPVFEVITNGTLLFGITLNVFVALQVNQPLWLFGNLPIGLLLIIQLIENQKKWIEFSKANSLEAKGRFEKLAWKIVGLNPFLKAPLLFVLFLPIYTAITGFLMLFGQRPDSIVRAFTDTYKHGFSQLDYLCNNVQCGGHFLCSVAANGHKKVVQPIRYGERNGEKIICNRQLLIANAFEELVEEKFPKAHKNIRRNYNKVGVVVHRYYNVFNNKLVADLVYVLMKPLEIIFVCTLYCFDIKPENRIARQYLKKVDRQKLLNIQTPK